MPEQDSGGRQVQHAEEVVGVAFPASDEAPEVMEPGKQALDLPAPAIAAEAASILRADHAIRSVRGNHLDAEVAAELGVERIAVVTAVADQAGGKRAEEAVRERRADEGGFAGRSAGHVDGERKTMTVANRHDFAAFAAASRTDGRAPFFAELKLASMNASVKSILPRSRRSSANRRSTRINTPVRCQC